ncbi:hypothetical protein ABE218_08185 [Bacillus smithii]
MNGTVRNKKEKKRGIRSYPSMLSKRPKQGRAPFITAVAATNRQ